MGIAVTVESGEARAAQNLTNRFVLIGPAAEGVGECFELDPGADPGASCGYGLLSEQAAHHLKNGSSIILAPSAITTIGTIGAVTKTGGGPTPTVALTSGYTSPTDAFSFAGKVSRAGAGPAAQLQYNLDGGTAYPYTLDIPAEAPAVITGNVDITYGLDLATKTLIHTAPSSVTVTFPAGPVAAGATGALLAATASVVGAVVLDAGDLLAAGVAIVNDAHGARLVFTTGGVTPASIGATVTIAGNGPDGLPSAGEVLNLSQIAGSATSVLRYRLDSSFTATISAASDVDATISISYAAIYPDAASIVDAYNVAAAAGGLAVRMRAAQQVAGTTFAQLYTTSAGSGVTQTIDASSTADTVLGVSGSATGAAATTAIPYTGFTVAWPASSVYEADTTYTWSTTAPKSDVAAILAAAAIPRAESLSFGEVIVLQPSDSAGNCKTLADGLDTLVGGWHTDSADPIGPTWSIQTPLHTASAVAATNAANIAANDAAVKLAFVAETSLYGEVCHGDVYVSGSKIKGSFRRGAVAPKSARAAAIRCSRDPGAGGTIANLPGCSLVHPDGVTLARDENTATTRMGTQDGPGFTTLRRRGTAGVRVAGSFSRAGAASRLFRFPVMRAAYLAAETLRDLVQPFELADWSLDSTGKLRAVDAASLAAGLTTSMREKLVLPPNTHFSSVSVAIDTAEKMADTDNLTVTATLQQRGYSENVIVTLSVVGSVVTTTVAA